METFAWKVLTFITVLYLPTHEQIASLLEEGTLLVSRPASSAIWQPDTFAFYVMLESEISTAYSAIHSAGSDEFLVHFI